MATEREVWDVLDVLISAYPNAKLIEGREGAPGTIDVYATMLADLPALELLAAVKYCINTRPDWFPTVANIREAAKKLHKCGETVSGADAWGIVIRAIREVGVYRRPQFEDPAIARSVDALGWRNICMSDEQDFTIRAHFIKAYEAYSDRCRDEDELLRIPEAKQIILQLAQSKQTKVLTEG